MRNQQGERSRGVDGEGFANRKHPVRYLVLHVSYRCGRWVRAERQKASVLRRREVALEIRIRPVKMLRLLHAENTVGLAREPGQLIKQRLSRHRVDSENDSRRNLLEEFVKMTPFQLRSGSPLHRRCRSHDDFHKPAGMCMLLFSSIEHRLIETPPVFPFVSA